MPEPKHPALIQIHQGDHITLRNIKIDGPHPAAVYVGPEATNVKIRGLVTNDVDIPIDVVTEQSPPDPEADTPARPRSGHRRVWTMGRVPWHEDEPD